ncbi:MAG: D-amino-acid transaminase [Alphaproteobacteria bacterium]|nr:D-amino-acid transaminase [Alphaproteobacteria bacterium]
MPRYCYVNGRFTPHNQGAVHIEDRGYQFADGVYEVVTVADGKLVDEEGHMARLDRSLKELRMPAPMKRAVLQLKMRELIRLNGLTDGLVYMQVTRGVAPRNHAFPAEDTPPALVMTTKRMDFASMRKFTDGVSVVTRPDLRWARCDIKTVSLLPNCLAKQEAYEAGAYEAWLVKENGEVTEGSSSNAWIVTADGKLITRPPTNEILNGITRRTIITLAAEEGLTFEERAFSVDEAHAAAECFVSSATSFVTPVVKVDDAVIGDGSPGPLSRKLLDAYKDYIAGRRDRAA